MLEKIREIICDNVDIEPEEITEDSKFITDLGMSSLDLVMIAVELEKEFGVEIPNKLFVEIKTVGDLVKYLEENKK